MHPRTSLGLALLLCCVASGCQKSSGPQLVPVSGLVTLDDVPLPSGQIVFHDPDGHVGSVGGAIVQGHYTLNSPPRRMQVEITDYRDVVGQFDESNPGAKIPDREQYIPARFNVKTELTAEVKDGKNKIDFPLSSKK